MRGIWLRHGETEANARRCYLGHLDSALTEKGQEQVSLAAELLGEAKAARLYTSDLGRCVETAKVVGRILGLEPELDSRLRELDFGQWDGKTYEEVMSSRNRAFLERWYKNPFEIAPPEGETLCELGQRVDEWVEQTFAKTRSNETIIIVSHGGPIRWFQSRWLRGDSSTYWQTESVPPGGTLMAVWDGKQFTLNKGAGV
ncbi:histidine phosphatase family protein [Cohnella sp.]|uniref:histidine phosphatase family protein n=1 Tax=Cohnella sp. TaxID=1883426 RepID=UPI003563A77D